MCGIGGFVGSFEPFLLDQMNSTQIHRGLNDKGVWYEHEGPVGLAHTCLSIIDLSSSGLQTMKDNDGPGEIVFNELHFRYSEADLGLFASSCENMPNILLETMASGLPIAFSNRVPMPEVLGDAGVYFDLEQPVDVAHALHELIESPPLRAELAQASYQRARQYSWQRCANETVGFLEEVEQYKDSICVAS